MVPAMFLKEIILREINVVILIKLN